MNSVKILDGSVTNDDIAGGAAIAASKINTIGLDADTLDGKDSSFFAAGSHSHDSTYAAVGYGLGSSPTFADAPVMLPDGPVVTIVNSIDSIKANHVGLGE